MALSFWSDKKITLTVSGKADNNSGINDVIITGSKGILCSLTMIGNTDNGIAGNDKTNTDSANTDNSTVTFYASVEDSTKSSATGDINIKIKWQGSDNKPDTGDETYSDEHTISDITIMNAVGSVKFTASNDLWINGATVSENTINLNVSLSKAESFNTDSTNNYIYYTSAEGDSYKVYNTPTPLLMTVTSGKTGLVVAKKTADSTSITLLFNKNTDVSTNGYIDYAVNGSYDLKLIANGAKVNVGQFTGKLKNPITAITFKNAEATIDAYSDYDAEYNVATAWGGKAYSYDKTLSGSGKDLATEKQTPDSNNVGAYTFNSETAGTYNLTLKTTENSAPSTVTGTTTLYVTSVEIKYTAPQIKTGLVYNGEEQALMTNGTAEGGTIKFSTDNNLWYDTIPTATDAGEYTLYWYIKGDASHNDVPTNTVHVTISLKDVTITAGSDSKVYDGTSLTCGTTTQTGLITNHTYTCTVASSLTNVGTANNVPSNAKIYDSSNIDVTSNYNITYKNGTLTVTTRAITVKAADATKVFDNTALTSNDYTITSTTKVASNQTITVTNSGSITYYGTTGTTTNTVSTVVIKDASGNDVTSNYTITKSTGTLTITPCPVTLTAESKTVEYNDEEYTLSTLTVTSGKMYNLYYVLSTKTGYLVSDSGTWNPTVKVYTDKTKTTEVTSSYTITIVAGTLTITARKTTVTADSGSKTYDGSALTKTSGCTATNIVEGHTVTSTNTGSATYVTDAGTNTISTVKIVDTDNVDVTANYAITKVTGKLTINKRDLTVTASSANKTYDGSALTSKTATADNLATTDHLHSVTIASSLTKAGTTNNVPTEAKIYNGTHGGTESDVTANYNITYANGTLTVTKATPTLTLQGVNTDYDGSPHWATATASVDGTLYWSLTTGVTASTGKALSLIANTATNVTSITDDASKSPDFIVYVIFVPTDSDDYNSIDEKTISMNINDVSVTLPTANSSSVVYDDVEHACSFTNGIGGSITKYRYSTDNSTWTESSTNPAFKTVGTRYVQAYYTADTNHSGSAWTASGKVIITQKEVKFVSGSATYEYDTTTHKLNTVTLASGYSVVSGHTFSASNEVSATNVADSKTFTASVIIKDGNGNDVTSNYYISSVTAGSLTITAKAVTVTADSGTKMYDGSALTKKSGSASGLLSGHHLHSITISSSLTNVGTANNVPTSCTIYNGTHSGTESDVTANYKVTYKNGTLTVTSRDITFTADSANKAYDGTALTKQTYTISGTGLASTDHVHSFTITGSQTDTGSSNNVPSNFKIYNGTHGGTESDVTSNYTITYENGTLTIGTVTATLTLSGGGTSFTYVAGSEQGVIYLTASVAGTVYYTTDGSDPTSSSTRKSKAIAAGTKTSFGGREAAGTTTFKAYLHPTDSTNYKDSSAVSGTITIAKATPTAKFNSISGTYTGSAYTMTAQASVAGTLYYTYNGTALTADNYSSSALGHISITTANTNTNVNTQTNACTLTYKGYFVPTDTANYNSVVATSNTCNIAKASSSVTLTGATAKYHNKATATATWSGGDLYYATSTDNKTWADYKVWSTGCAYREALGILYVKAYVKGDSNHNDSSVTSVVECKITEATDVSLNVTLTERTYTGSALVIASAIAHGCTYYLGAHKGYASTSESATWADENTSISEIDAGSYYVWYKATGDTNHSGTNIDETFKGYTTIYKAASTNPTLTGSTTDYDTAYKTPGTISVSGGSGGTIIYSYSTDNGSTWQDTYDKPTRNTVGTTLVTAHISGDSNHNDTSETDSVKIIVNKSTDAYVTVTVSGALNYTGSALTIASVASAASHGITNYYLGASSSSTTAPTSWSSANTALTTTAAGTYYIWYKYDLDSNHSNTNTGTYTGKSVTISKVTATSPTLTGSTVYFHNTAALSVTAGTGGTTYYVTSTDKTTWTTETTTKPTLSTVGTLYVKAYTKADSNHTDSTWSSIVALTVNKATDAKVTVTINTPLSYTGSILNIASVTSTNMHGITNYYLGFGKDASTAPTSWTENNSITQSAAGTYYVWYKYDLDGNHSNTNTGTYAGSAVINKVSATLPTSWSGKTVTYHATATVTATGASGGTLKFITSTDGKTWTSYTAATATTVPSRTEVGTTYVKCKVIGDSNHNDSAESTLVSLIVNTATDAYVTVTTSAKTYTGSAQTVASVTKSEGIKNYYLGFGKDASTAPTTWGSANTALTITDADTYYVWYKFEPDSSHSNTNDGTYVGSVVMNKASLTAPTLKGETVLYEKTATASCTSTVSGGTLYYKTCDSATGTYSNETTIAPTRALLGTTYVKAYIKGDKNHNNSADSEYVTLIVNKATDQSVTVTLTDRSYTGSSQIVASATSHGCKYYLAFGTDGTTAPSDTDSGWTNGSLTKQNVGTYYVWYKGTADSNHSADVAIAYKGTVKISAVKATAPTIKGATTDYDTALTTPATITVTAGSGGTTHYVTCSTSTGTFSNDTTTIPTKNTLGTIYVKAYTKGDDNHTDSDYTSAVALTVNKSTDQSVTVTTTTRTYNGSNLVIASATSHGCTYYLILGTDATNAPADTASGWTNGSLSASAAGTYYIWYKGTADSYHSANVAIAYKGTVVINKLKASTPTISGASKTYDVRPATVSASGSGGTLHYVTCSTSTGTFGNDTTTAPSLTTLGTTYVKAYIVGDSNHSNSDYTSAVAITVTASTDASVTVTLKTGLTYSGSALTIATATTHGCSSYTLGTGTSSAASSWASNNSALTGTNAGTYYVWYKGTADSNHSGDVSAAYKGSVTISAYDISKCTISLDTSSYSYSGTAKQPTPTVTFGSTTLTKDTDYTVSYSSNTNVGTATCTCTGKGNFTGTIKKTFTISKINPTYTAPTKKSLTYTGSAQALVNAGSNTTAGTFTYKLNTSSTYSTTIPTATNCTDCLKVDWIFTPTDTTNYNTITGTTITSTMAKATPTYTAPTNKNPSYTGSALLIITAGSTSHGTFYYSADESTWVTSVTDTAVKKTNAGTYSMHWKLTGDSNHNDVASTALSCTISKINPTYTAPTAKSVNYTGSAQAIITAGSNTTAGSFGYGVNTTTYYDSVTNTNVEATNVGTYTRYWKFTPTDTTNYNTKTGSLTTCKINAVAPTYTAPTNKNPKYTGSALLIITAGSTSHGTFSYSADNSTWVDSVTNSAVLKTTVSSYTMYWKLTGDSNHTSVASTSLTCSIQKATPTAKVVSSSLTYSGSAKTIYCQASVPGTFYATSDGTDITASNYSTAATITVTISKANTNTTLDSSKINVSTTTYKGYFIPSDTTNYNSVTATSGTLTIGKLKATTPTITGSSVAYDSKPATVSASGSGGTLHYVTCSTSTGTFGNDTTTAPTQTTVGTTYVKAYIVGDGNHSNSDYTSAVAITVTASTDTSVTVTTTARTYNKSALVVASATSHGCTYYLAFGTDGTTAPTSGWTNGSLSATNAGTYYIWYKGNADSGHTGSDITATYKGTVAISAYSISKCTVTLSPTSYSYNGYAHTPQASVSDGTTALSSIVYYDYIQSSGRQYIDTGVVDANDLEIQGDFMPTSYGNYFVFFSNGNSGSNGIRCFASSSALYCGYNASRAQNSVALALNTKYSVVFSKTKCTVNSTSYTCNTGTTALSNTLKLFYDGTYSTANAIGRIYGCKIYKNGTLVRDYKPCAYKGVIGLYDTVNSTFYDNAGVGVFTVGTATSTTGDYTVSYSSNINAGTVTVTCTGRGNYTGTITKTFTISKIDPTLTLSATSGTLTYPTTSGTFTASVTGGGTLSVVSSSEKISKATISSGTITYTWVAAGSATITVSAAASTNYNAKTATFTATIKKGSLSLSLSGNAPVYNSTSTVTLSGNTESGVVTWSTSNANYIAIAAAGSSPYNTATATGKSCAGSATITATVPDTTHYIGSSATWTKTATKATPTYTAPAKKSLTYTGSAQDLVTAGSNTTEGTFTYKLNTAADTAYSTTIPTAKNCNDCLIVNWKFTPKDTTNYNSASGTITSTMAKASLSLSISGSNPTFNSPSTLTLSGNSGSGTVSWSSASTTYITVAASGSSPYNTATATVVKCGGTSVITASVVATTNYASGTVTKTLTPLRATPTLTLSAASGTLVWNGTGTCGTFTASVTGNGTITATSSNTSVCTVSYSTTNNVCTITYNWIAAGTATITVSAAASTNYAAKTGTFAATIKKASLSLSLSGNNPAYKGTSTVTLSGNSGSGTVTWSSSNTSYITVAAAGSSPYNTATVTGVLCGTSITITASVAATEKYADGKCTKTMSATKVTPTISFSDLTFTKTYTGSGLTVDFTAPTVTTPDGTTPTRTYSIVSMTKDGSTYTNTSNMSFSIPTNTVTRISMDAMIIPAKYVITVRVTTAATTNFNSTTKDAKMTITLNKATSSIDSFSIDDLEFSPLDTSPTMHISYTGDGTISYSYLRGTTYPSSVTSSSAFGTYTCTATLTGTDYYTGPVSKTAAFNIVVPYMIFDLKYIGYAKYYEEEIIFESE